MSHNYYFAVSMIVVITLSQLVVRNLTCTVLYGIKHVLITLQLLAAVYKFIVITYLFVKYNHNNHLIDSVTSSVIETTSRSIIL